MNRRWIWTGLLCLVLTGLAAEPFSVLRMTDSEIILQFTMPEYKLTEVNSDGETWTRIDCPDALPSGAEGHPETWLFSQTVGLPVNGEMTVEVVSEQHRAVRNIRLVPMKGDSESPDEGIGNPDPRAYSSQRMTPSELTVVGESAFLRDRRFASLSLNAFQYTPAAKTLRVTTSAVIRVSISGDKTAARAIPAWGNPMDAAGDSFCINDRFARYWRKAVEPSNETPAYSRGLVDEIDLEVREEGIYKVTYVALADSMVAWTGSLGCQFSFDLTTLDPRYFELQDINGPVPIRFVGEADGVFNTQDYFEFYGDRHYGDEGYQDDITDINVYRLIYDPGHLGARMAVENGGLEVNDATQYVVPVAYQFPIHLENQVIYAKLGYGLEREDLYFWSSIMSPNLEIVPFQLEYPYESTSRFYDAKVVLYGSTHYQPPEYPADIYDHHASVRINAGLVGDKWWYYQSQCDFINNGHLLNSQLVHGANQLYISLPGDTGYGDLESVWFDYLEMTYWRQYKTDKDEMAFTKPQDLNPRLFQYELDNFSTPDVSLYKIGASYIVNSQVQPFTLDGQGPFKVVFQDYTLSDDTRYYAVTEAKKKAPLHMRANLPSSLKSPTNYANYLILTNGELARCDATQQYKAFWEQKGPELYGHPVTVEVVDVQDIYDEFSYGIAATEAIRDFLTYAYNNWNNAAQTGSSELTHVLLLGDGTRDYRYQSTTTPYNIIPVHMVKTEKLGATPSDSWYACVVGDDPVADLAIGRLNVWNSEQILQSQEKLQDYLDNPQFEELWQGRVVISAGGNSNDVTDTFSQQGEILRRKWIPEDYDLTRVYCTTQTVPPEYFGRNATLKDAINGGLSFLIFLGHGGGQIWSDYDLFHWRDVPSLANAQYPFVVSMACYCGAFESQGATSLGEALVMEPGKGAIAHVGFTGLGYLALDPVFADYLTEAMYRLDMHNTGDIITFTKAKLFTTYSGSGSRALTQSAELSGDPMVRLWFPTRKTQVAIADDTPLQGDVVHVTATFPDYVDQAKVVVTDGDEVTINTPIYLSVGGTLLDYDFPITTAVSSPGLYFVKVFGYGEDFETTGMATYAIGVSSVTDITLDPEAPTSVDSVRISARIADNSPINSVNLVWQYTSTINDTLGYVIPMTYSTADAKYYATSLIPPMMAGRYIYYYFRIVNASDVTVNSSVYNYFVTGADLKILDMKIAQVGSTPALRVQLQNAGTSGSPAFNVKCYKVQSDSARIVLVGSAIASALDQMTQEFVYIPLTTLHGTTRLRVIINPDHQFPEYTYDNNFRDGYFDLNLFATGAQTLQMTSIDGNVVCEIPPVFPPGSILYLNDAGDCTPATQPGISGVTMAMPDGDGAVRISPAYEVGALNTALLADTLGALPQNGRMRIKMHFVSPGEDKLDEVSLYRWNAQYRKWIYQGRNIAADSTWLILDITRLGTYALFVNSDHSAPTIDANVESQEFTHGGYIAGNGIISLVFTDTDGIDIIDHAPQLFLDGRTLSREEYTLAAGTVDLIQTPIKYQLDLDQGEYTLLVGCTDVNGNYNERSIRFKVNTTFDVINLANYPNPIVTQTIEPVNEGRTRFTYVLTDNADNVTLKIYTVSGRLVRTFKHLPSAVGYHEYPRTLYGWDCTDDDGMPLANGAYFYRLSATRDGKKIERTQKMAILK
jgi:hypothetical protein